MRRIRFRRPSPSMAVALLALFVALGGTSYAAKKISAGNIKTGAVGTRAVKNRALTSLDIRRDALGGATIREERLDAAKIDVRRLKRVPSAGFAATVGKNAVGATALGTVTRRFGAAAAVPNTGVAKAEVSCKKGEVVLGGGARWGDNLPAQSLQSSFASSDGSWTVVGSNGTGAPRNVQAFAMCLAP